MFGQNRSLKRYAIDFFFKRIAERLYLDDERGVADKKGILLLYPFLGRAIIVLYYNKDDKNLFRRERVGASLQKKLWYFAVKYSKYIF